MNCREALAKLYEYLDRELNDDDKKHLEQHMEHCSDCLQRYELEEEFNNFVKSKVCCQPDVTALKERIKKKIDQIDSGGSPRNFLFLVVPLAIAAVVALLVFVPTGRGADPQAVLTAVKPLADEHTKCLDHLLQYQVQSSDPVVVQAAMQKITDLPSELFKPATPDYEIQGATIAHLPMGDDAQLDFHAFNQNVSVFVLPPNSIDKKPFKKLAHGDEVYYVGSCPYYQYVIWECEGNECVAVSKLDQPRLLEFAQNF